MNVGMRANKRPNQTNEQSNEQQERTTKDCNQRLQFMLLSENSKQTGCTYFSSRVQRFAIWYLASVFWGVVRSRKNICWARLACYSWELSAQQRVCLQIAIPVPDNLQTNFFDGGTAKVCTGPPGEHQLEWPANTITDAHLNCAAVESKLHVSWQLTNDERWCDRYGARKHNVVLPVWHHSSSRVNAPNIH